MSKKFYLNTKTHCLHIEGYCHLTNVKKYDGKIFNTEEEARAYGGQAVWLCTTCQKKREKNL